MRTVPLQFVAEDTLNDVRRIQKARDRAAALAGSLGLSASVVAEHWDAIEQHKWI